MVNLALLEEIGLTKAEAKVYLALLELGSCSTGKIVEKSKASSSKIYEILEKLMQKGLVSFVVKSGVKYFEAAPPRRILDYMGEKKKELEEKTRDVQKMLPELELAQKLSKHKSEATIFKGLKGVQTAYEDILKTLKAGDEYYVVGGMNPHKAYFSFVEQFQRRRAARGIKVKLLYSEPAKSLAQAIEKLPKTEIKFTPNQFLFSCFVLMYKTKTLIVVAAKEDLTLFQIDNKDVTDSFIAQFELLWNQDAQSYKGFDATVAQFENMISELRAGEEYCVLGASLHLGGERLKKWLVDFHQRRIEKGVKAKLLSTVESRDGIIQNVRNAGDPNFHLSQVRTLAPGMNAPFQVNLFRNKVVITLWDEMRCFVIESQKLKDNFQNYFETLWNQKIRTFEGIEQTTSFFTNILNDLQAGEEYFVLNGNYGKNKKLGEFFKSYHQQRHKKGIKANLLFNQNVKSIAKDLALSPCEVKFLPPEFQSPLQVTFYKNKLYISIWSENPIGFLIEQKGMVEAFKAYFDLLWNQKGK
ncbi:hypothetical protein HYV86_05835 [Candidatus Woesearchaeota archaeon]|nr:hypothetical protein [Candidatus Woesearchaeota archaeon]